MKYWLNIKFSFFSFKLQTSFCSCSGTLLFYCSSNIQSCAFSFTAVHLILIHTHTPVITWTVYLVILMKYVMHGIMNHKIHYSLISLVHMMAMSQRQLKGVLLIAGQTAADLLGWNLCGQSWEAGGFYRVKKSN